MITATKRGIEGNYLVMWGSGYCILKITQHHRFSMMHYGTKPGHFETSIIHFPSNERVTEVSAARHANKASRAEQASE